MREGSHHDEDVEQVVRPAEVIELPREEALRHLEQVEHTPSRIEHQHQEVTTTHTELFGGDPLDDGRVSEWDHAEGDDRTERDSVGAGRLEELEAPAAVWERKYQGCGEAQKCDAARVELEPMHTTTGTGST